MTDHVSPPSGSTDCARWVASANDSSQGTMASEPREGEHVKSTTDGQLPQSQKCTNMRSDKTEGLRAGHDSCDIRPAHTRKKVQRVLNSLRESHTVEEARQHYASSLPSYTVLELATGGGLDSLAAAYAGFRHLGGTEDISRVLGAAKARLFEDLTGAPCFGDTRAWKDWVHLISNEVDYMKSGQPCTDYASLGKRQGRHGSKGGDLFLLQLKIIEHLKPKIVRLEMVPTALDVNEGYEVKMVLETLSSTYHVNPDILTCWKYGDPTARQRIIIVGLRRDLYKTNMWEWPDPICDESFYPIARDIAVPDSEVPPNYWRHDTPLTYDNIKVPAPGLLMHIGYAGDPNQPNEAGFSDKPNNIQGWDGNLSTQMATNGGSRRPACSWLPGEPIGDTRMTVPIESCRAASLHEESYMKFARRHYSRKDLGMSFDQWLRELVNLGVPLSTGTAIDLKVREMLELINVSPTDHCSHSKNCIAFNAVQSGVEARVKPVDDHHDDGLMYPMDHSHVLVSNQIGMTGDRSHEGLIMGVGDSGASDHLHDASLNSCLKDALPSDTSYQIANGKYIQGDLKGDMDITVLNLDHQPKGPKYVDHTIHTTTIKGIGQNLWSLEAAFRDQGYDIRMSHGYKKGDWTGMYRPPEGHKYGPESFIPMVYNYNGSGGWRIPYVVRRPGTSDIDHLSMLESIYEQSKRDQSHIALRAEKLHELNAFQAQKLERHYWACSAVTQTVSVRVLGERDIRPAFTYGGLRRYKAKNWHEFHSAMAHMGEPGLPCAVCSMFKGEARPIPKHRHGKPRDRRPGHTWHMDMIVFRERSEEGSKYLIVLTDECTQAIQLIPLYWKSDATHELRRWIKSMRSHPAYVGLDYRIIGRIVTDNDGAWSEENSKFQSMIEELGGLEVEYTEPGDKRKNPRAEGMNKIVEAGIQSLLYEKNLPPSWWQRAANDVMFLANRFPPYSTDASVPINGEQPAPIELLFHNFIPRSQVYSELDNYVAVGTPALCHKPSVKSSDLEPKVKWGIAIGQRGKLTRWMCPFTNSRFKSRSFTAFTLKSGLNWSQFLGLGDISPSAQSRMLPQDEDTQWTIELPAVRLNTVDPPPPVRELMDKLETGEVTRADNAPDGKELCEFLPRMKRRAIRGDDPNYTDTHDHDDHDDCDDHDHVRIKVLDEAGESIPVEQSSLPSDDDNDDNLYVDGPAVADTPHQPNRTDPTGDPVTISDRLPSRSKRTSARRKRGKRVKVRATQHDKDHAGLPSTQELHVQAYGLDMDEELELEELEAKLMHKLTLKTDGYTSWSKVCKHMHSVFKQLPFEHHHIYRIWLLTKPKRGGERALHTEDLPKSLCDGRGPLKEGLLLPYPSGPHWQRLLGNHEYRKMHGDRLHADDIIEEQAYIAMRMYRQWLDKDIVGIAMLCRAAVSDQISLNEIDDLLNSIISNDIEELGLQQAMSAMKARKVKGRQKISVVDDPEPKTMIEALMGDRAEEWVESIYKEFNGLLDQGVFSGPWTKDELRKAGITSKPVPCSIALTHKIHDGVLQKLKTRICLAGHRGNVTKGIHYTDVFSPSPVQHTERILQAMRVNLHLENLTWDVKMAYTWAPLPPGERIAVVYPEGFKRSDPNGEELFLVLEKNLYGLPSASRGWSKTRDEFILARFNDKGWRCHRTRQDPCLFVIDRGVTPSGLKVLEHERSKGPSPTGQPPVDLDCTSELEDCSGDLPEGVERSWVLIHTDDCDAYGTSLNVLHEINDIMNKEWTTEVVDSSFVLGIKRSVDRDPNGWSVTMSMTQYIEDMMTTFKDDLTQTFGNRKVTIPFPEGLILTKSKIPAEGEVSRNIARGYQRLVGSLLWCVRHVMPICAYGCSQLCKLMATPTDEAWHAALWMLNYIYQHRNEGITFRENDTVPCAFVDASNRDDPTDGKTQYGYTIQWGGPLITKSGKLNHVGINSTYNEYMALHHCIKQVVWLRQLFIEIGLGWLINDPTRIYADNKQANNLCNEDLVTAGNMYFRTSYHYNKEAVRDKYVSVHYINTQCNLSDVTTKALGSNKIREFQPYLHGQKPIDTLLTNL